MLAWPDVVMAQEHYRDLYRQAAHDRLVLEARAGQIGRGARLAAWLGKLWGKRPASDRLAPTRLRSASQPH
jgi:hypothetical protein